MSQAAKIAFITGGSRGLGRNTAEHLARRGYDIIFTYQHNEAQAKIVVGLIEASGQKAVALPLDVGQSADFDRFVGQFDQALKTLGATQFDVLVNNAGTSLHESIEQTTEAQLDAVYNVHFKGVYLLTQKLLPRLRDGGNIVNISSGLTRFAFPGSSAYAAMKSAVETFTRYLARELGARRIRANVVAPGAIQTDFSGGVVRDDPALNKMISEATALGRPGLPEDIGPMIAALVSEDNRWVNAQRIEASGGMAI